MRDPTIMDYVLFVLAGVLGVAGAVLVGVSIAAGIVWIYEHSIPMFLGGIGLAALAASRWMGNKVGKL